MVKDDPTGKCRRRGFSVPARKFPCLLPSREEVGAIIAIYPIAISNYFVEQGPKVYGRVFTAWGFAGLVAPWTAGMIYDTWSGYNPALIIASVTALLSALTVRLSRFERQDFQRL